MDKTSLLSQHHRILGYSDEAPRPGDRAEAEQIERLALPTLSLPHKAPASQRLWRWQIALPALAAVAALLLAFVLRGELQPDDGLRMKGEHYVSVFWERDGQVEPWKPGTSLQSGDRVRAEVLASEDIIAYAAITDDQGRLLLPAGEVLSSAMQVAGGERQAFAGSFKLVGMPEGETLVILTCESTSLAEGLLQGMGERQDTVLTRNQLPKGCSAQLFPLR